MKTSLRFVGASWRKYALLCAIAMAYFVAGKLCLRLALLNPSASAVWAPTGVALAALLLCGSWVWPAIFVGAFLVNATTAGNLATSLAIAAGNTLEGLAGAYLTNRFVRGALSFDRPQDIFKFMMLAGVLGACISATVGVTSLCAAGFAHWADFRPVWLTWWMGDVGGAAIVAPFLILWALDLGLPWKRADLAELALMALLILLLGRLLFGGYSLVGIRHYPLEFLYIPLLFWVAYRHGPRETAGALALLSAVATRGTVRGFGPFVQPDLNTGLLLLQGFLVANAVATLTFAAVSAERRSAEKALRTAHDELEDRVRRRTEDLQKMNEANRRLASIIESTNDAVVSTTEDGIITSWNAGAVRLFGYSPREALGRPIDMLAPSDARGVQADGEGRYEVKRMRKDGTLIDVELTMSPIKDGAGRPAGYCRIEHDITERKLAERELQRRTEELSRSNAELNLFASIVSHELQEPLRKILSFGDLVKAAGSGAGGEREEYVRRMQDAAARMQRLVNDMLQLSRVTTNAGPLQLLDLREVVQGVALDFETRLKEAEGRLRIGRLPIVLADELQMRQLFGNLIANAYKFRKKDAPLRVNVSCRRLKTGFVEIGVRDNGIGFEQQYAERILQPFQRLHRRGEYEGSGMGLAICERILMRHGGSITARSEPGKGAKFVVILPLPVEEPGRLLPVQSEGSLL